MSFIRAYVDSGGYIRNDDGGLPYGTIHRETRRMEKKCITFASIQAAKAALDDNEHPSLVAKLTEEGGIDTLYCFDLQKDEVRDRLEYWKGCYGAWPLRTMKR